jgi:phosphoglucomutase
LTVGGLWDYTAHMGIHPLAGAPAPASVLVDVSKLLADGIIMDLLAAEMMAKSGRDPGELYRDLTYELEAPVYERIDAAVTPAQKTILSKLSPERAQATELAGDTIVAKLRTAPGNGASIGGLKVVTEQGWFAARPSGTEDVYKLYAESFRGQDHLQRIQEEAQALIAKVLAVAT